MSSSITPSSGKRGADLAYKDDYNVFEEKVLPFTITGSAPAAPVLPQINISLDNYNNSIKVGQEIKASWTIGNADNSCQIEATWHIDGLKYPIIELRLQTLHI